MIDVKKIKINEVVVTENFKPKSVLAVGPHPDDIEFGCGGTLHKYSAMGHSVSMMVMTRGEVGGIPEIREKELLKSAEILGVTNVFICPFIDTKVPLTKEVITAIEEVIKDINANYVFVNYFDDTHQDHRVTAECVISASRYIQNLLFFEVPSTQNFNPHIFSNIVDEMEIKRNSLSAHHSQVNKVNIADLSILECAEANAVFRGVQGKVKYAEAFRAQRFFINSI